MSKFQNGISFYTKGKVEVTVPFPEEDVCCANCIFYTKRHDQPRCYLTSNVLFNPQYDIDCDCPLNFSKEN